MKKSVIFLLFFVFLGAKNLADVYRYYGVKPLVSYIEKVLQNKNYWLSRLKNIDVKYGYYEGDKYILVCIKRKKILNVFSYNNGLLSKISSYSVLTGLDGDKEKEGDLKTPIGVYRLKSLIQNVEQFYGPFAFVTSYPNLFDRINGKNGHGIWIHGLPLDGTRDSNNTKGCIVMKNPDLEKLKDEIDYKKTYLLISEDKTLTATKKEIASILAFIYKWRYAWQHNDFNKYKKFYAKDFKRSDGKNLREFLDYKKRVFENKKGQKVEIFFRNINIIPYQNINNHKIFRVDMYEIYDSKHYKYSGHKEIYVRLNGDIKIVAEK